MANIFFFANWHIKKKLKCWQWWQLNRDSQNRDTLPRKMY